MEAVERSLTVTPFSFEGLQLRTVVRDGEPWFVATDVCSALEHTNSRVAVGRLDADERGVSTVYTPGGDQRVALISESGLYSLILTSRKPEAKKFKKWVTGTVLPKIRKTGSYHKPVMTVLEILAIATESEKGRLLAIEQRDYAIATKALIGSKREATAMATASAAVREVKRLRDEVGFSARHATILQVEYALSRDFSFVPLRRWCNENEVVAESVPDKRYPKGVKAWPAAAWMSVYSVDISKLPKLFK